MTAWEKRGPKPGTGSSLPPKRNPEVMTSETEVGRGETNLENRAFATATVKTFFKLIHNALIAKLRCNGYDITSTSKG